MQQAFHSSATCNKSALLLRSSMLNRREQLHKIDCKSTSSTGAALMCQKGSPQSVQSHLQSSSDSSMLLCVFSLSSTCVRTRSVMKQTSWHGRDFQALAAIASTLVCVT